MERMDFKQISYDLKELDDTKGVIVAYANVYNNTDSDGDISAYGSFTKTVSENFKRIRVLKDHNPREMIGIPKEINTTDPYGLLTTTQFNMNKNLSRDMFTDIKLMVDNGQNAELSIGYKALKRDQKNKSIITEYYLGEYSFLSNWASNPLAIVQGIKGIKETDVVIKLIEKSYNLDYSDKRLREIEAILKALSNEPSETDTLIEQPLILETLKSFTNSLKTK